MVSIQDLSVQDWLIIGATPFYIILIAIESILSNYQHKNYYSFKDSLMNLWLNIANTIIALLFKVASLAILYFIYQYKFILIAPTWLYWLLLFLLLDFCFYVEHRSEHYVRILWAVHVTHHSSQHFNLTTGFRSSVFRPLVSVWFFLPLALLGFHPLHIILMDAICQIYGILVHTRYFKKMPKWFELFLVSPSHHRVHHASNIIYLDKNMGMVLIVWDRLLGTFQQEEDFEKVVFGLTKNPEKPFHPIKIITHEWESLWKDINKKGITWRDRINYLIAPPGWSHDGSTHTAEEMRNNLKKQSL